MCCGAEPGNVPPAVYEQCQQQASALALRAPASDNELFEDPVAIIDLWQSLAELSEGQPPQFLSTLPGNDKRIRALQGRLPQATKLQQVAAARDIKLNCQR